LTALLLLALPSLLACTAPRRQAFDPAGYAPFAVPGSSAIEGRGRVQDDSGSWHDIAGREVILGPVTPYAEEWWQRVVLGDEDLGPPDPRLAPYLRTVIADADGGFRFAGLPAGDYFLTCDVTWTSAGLEGRFVMHGAWLHERVSVRPDTTVRIDIGP
ncbi:MAG TPA: carboxypeptidase-like regulatory domain-containing protein, partial [Planctomycetota bacterium]|nr:carboxypeptidase-like regulatory domain-containing protein [Planctomycetota bacterium]